MIVRSLSSACIVYRRSLAPLVRAEMLRWETEASAIPDRARRRLALEKLAAEGFNAEAAAMAATVCPPARRAAAASAIVAVELMFDHLDGVSEGLPRHDPIAAGVRLHAPLIDVFAPTPFPAPLAAERERYRGSDPYLPSDPYLASLARVARDAIDVLPAGDQIIAPARRCAELAVEAQTRMHASALLGAGELEAWARGQERHDAQARGERPGAESRWREVAAGAACSVLCLHALIAAAADPATSASTARRIVDAYAPLGAAITLLDGIVDAASDRDRDRIGYLDLYESEQAAGDAIRRSVREARERCVALPKGAHHVMMVAAAVAFELSSLRAPSGSFAARLASRLVREHRSLLLTPLAVMRAWRTASRTSALIQQLSPRAGSLAARPQPGGLGIPVAGQHATTERSKA